MSNKDKYPEAWNFYVREARNIQEESDLNRLGNYRIPKPDKSGKFIYAETIEQLWSRFIIIWHTITSLNAPTCRGKIQYITQVFNR